MNERTSVAAERENFATDIVVTGIPFTQKGCFGVHRPFGTWSTCFRGRQLSKSVLENGCSLANLSESAGERTR